ncbi:MAG TPA: cob(I)yrinic acid a,c-diamide adenosyltransferase [Acidilobales archaeon]|nr:cob(I)yrinic acid a,c-diamide adenosyltransferase [Acidilobales archaeon]
MEVLRLKKEHIGDEGYTYLLSGKRVPKAHPLIEAIGSLDELNSLLGGARSLVSDDEVKSVLFKVQRSIFDVGKVLAGISGEPVKRSLDSYVSWFDELTSNYWGKLSEPKNVFVIPSGCGGGEFLHYARAVCRRVERVLVKLKEFMEVPPGVLKYINRLSDLLYVLARYVNQKNKCEELL